MTTVYSTTNKQMCDSCGYSPIEVKPYQIAFPFTHQLCALCAGTSTGNAHAYPDHYPDANAMKVICYVGNVILSEIKNAHRP